MKFRTVLLATAILPSISYAEYIPDYTRTPPPVTIVSGNQASLNAKERHALKLSDEWKNRNTMPVRGQDGTVRFMYGATLPTVVCAPLYPCNLILQAGETVQQIDVGDPVRWKVTPSVFGSGENTTTALVIKPVDSGLKTALSIATDRRLYTVKAVSRRQDWMPKVAFSYPEDTEAAWKTYHAEQRKLKKQTILPDGKSTTELDFGFTMTGDKPEWKPIRVYTDGIKTFIQFPKEMQHTESPALVALGEKKHLFAKREKEIVNFRHVGDRYIVDKVLKRAALIAGVGGKQTKVTIMRTSGEKK